MRELVSVHISLNELYSLYVFASSFVSAQELKHELDSSYINLKVYVSLIRHID